MTFRKLCATIGYMNISIELRNNQIAEMRRRGDALERIGEVFNITRERVRQIVVAHDRANGTGVADAEKTIRSEKRNAAKAAIFAKKNARLISSCGCDFSIIEAISTDPTGSRNSPVRKYLEQKSKAKRRGIEFHMTFPEWWSVWERSGKWEQRGRGSGFCMARNGDVGPYAVWNVYITTIGANFSDYHRTRALSKK